MGKILKHGKNYREPKLTPDHPQWWAGKRAKCQHCRCVFEIEAHDIVGSGGYSERDRDDIDNMHQFSERKRKRVEKRMIKSRTAIVQCPECMQETEVRQ